MDYRIIWSPEAIDDIDAICNYIARDSEYYAESIAQKIFKAPEQLMKFPHMGRVIPELNNESIRELLLYQYRIIYEIAKEEIHIITVIHGKRLLKNI
jgi:addiction module RelE/StbE family toxin